MTAIDQVLAAVNKNFPSSLSRLFELLRFPTVATDPKYHAACRDAAHWLKNTLEKLGFEAELRPTTGQPVVIGKYRSERLPSHAPHVLFYGHYDVQPADPIDLWQSPPFEPQIRKGKDGKESIFARGACDDKGQLMTFLEATRAWLEINGSLPVQLTVLLEGDEESDSTHLDHFLAKNRQELAADLAFVCDTAMWNAETPAIKTRLRGCICEEVKIRGPSIDLHSGYYGGPASNPIKVLSRILGQIHDRNGKVAIPGFYDGVRHVPASLRKQWARLRFPARKFLVDVGLAASAGEKGFTLLEQLWGRPTAEINGIWGGYRGEGTKTVIPAEASAKLSFRLVSGQNPVTIRKALRTFVRQRLPNDCRASFVSQGGDSSGILIDSNSPWIAHARKALKAEWGKEAVEVGSGASIPVVESFKKRLCIESLLVGFMNADDSPHSPNEKYDVESFRRGIRSWARIISEVSEGNFQ